MFGFLGDPKIIASKKSGGMTGCALALLPVFGILLAHWVLVQNYVCLLIRNWDDEWCTGWWFQIFFMFIPTWGNNPIWRAYFSEGGWWKTTNYKSLKKIPSNWESFGWSGFSMGFLVFHLTAKSWDENWGLTFCLEVQPPFFIGWFPNHHF